MELTDQRDIAADTDAVWRALTDADVLRRCIPGCQEMSGNPEDGYEATVVQKVGPVKATFKGRVELLDVVEGQSCRISGEGKGGPAGFAKGAADVVLAPVEGGTRLSYDVTAKVGGKLAQLGGRVIDGFSKKMADQFFDNFKGVVEGNGTAIEGAGLDAADAQATGADATQGDSPGSAPDAGTGVAAAPSAGPEEDPTATKKKGWFQRLASD